MDETKAARALRRLLLGNAPIKTLKRTNRNVQTHKLRRSKRIKRDFSKKEDRLAAVVLEKSRLA